MFQSKIKYYQFSRSKGFTYLDVIYGLTVILIILGVIFGSIRMIEKRLRENQLIVLADSFANKIFDEVRLRKFDENIASIVENGLTVNLGTENEDINDWSTLDDIDDFHGITATDAAFPGLETNVTVDYVNLDTDLSTINLSVIPTVLKRVQLDVNHPLFDNPIRYSTIIGGNFDPEILIVRAYPTDISVNLDPGKNIITFGQSVEFTVQFSEIVYVVDNDEPFAFYIDIISSLLEGVPGEYSSRSSNVGEIRADYISGNGTNQLKFQLDVGENMGGADTTDYISYRGNLVIEYGIVTDNEGNEIIYSLPNTDSDNSFAYDTKILPLLPQFDMPIFTEAQMDDFDQSIENVFIEQSFSDVFNTWSRFVNNNYYVYDSELNGCDPSGTQNEIENNCFTPNLEFKAKEWDLIDFGQADERIQMQINNTQEMVGIINPDPMDNFSLEVTLWNDDQGDNDLIGIVIAFVRYQNYNYYISAQRTRNGTDPCNWALVAGQPKSHNHGQCGHLDNKSWMPGLWGETMIPQRVMSSTSNFPSWNDSSYPSFTRVKVTRKDNIITAETNGWVGVNNDLSASRTDAVDTPYLVQTYIRLDLETAIVTNKNGEVIDSHNSITPDYLEKFLSTDDDPCCSYGYTAFSQQGATFYDISLAAGTVQRQDFSILVSTANGQTEATEYYKIDEEGSHHQQVENLQIDYGYLRPLINSSNGNKFLLTETGIMVYPFEDQ
jgi:type II secretory pathway pseudopilin PulG